MPRMTPEQKAAREAERLKGLDEFKPEEPATPEPVVEALAHDADPEVFEEPEEKPAPTSSRPRSTKKAAPKSSGLFTPLEDVDEFLNLLYWGREGSGKTSDALSAANHGRVLVINAEGGLKKMALRKRGINIDNIQVWPRPGEPVTFEGLEAAMLQVKSDLMDDPQAWFAVIWDSGTELSAAMTGASSDDRIAKARRRGATINTFDRFFTDRGDYGVSGKMLRTLLRLGRDLQCHFIVTALERRDVDEDTSKVAYGPAVPPGLQSDMLGYMDLVLHTKEADDERDYFRALAKRAGTRRAKDRFDALPKVLVEPTVERVLAYLDESLTEATDPLQEPVRAEAEKATEKAEKKPAATRTRAARGKTSAAPAADGEGNSTE